VAAEHDPHVEQLLTHIKEQRGFDFTGYKRPSLVRRIQRRLDAVDVPTFEAYLDHLHVHTEEFSALFDTVLINVTGFFRDADVWADVRDSVIPGILERNRGQVRVWSAGCASGEEAFTIAILLAEALGIEEFRERVKIYATDVDEHALTSARSAVYGERQVQGVPPELLARYFDRGPGGYTLTKELRRAVIFGRNDLVQDAPISRVDLLTCRNTLMYLNAETQSRIVRRMHFALVPDGVLLLGKAETLLTHSELFQPVDLKRRIFRRVGPPAGRTVALTLGRQASLPEDGPTERLKEEALVAGPAAQVVVALSGELVASNRRAELLFGIGPRDVGRPFQDLEISYRPAELRSSIDQALAERQPVWVHDVELPRPAGSTWLDIQVVPLFGQASRLIGVTVVFGDVTRTRTLQLALEETNSRLELAYEELQSANEELETTNEELQSTIEELETTNEELQSTNEELETLNEELQSMNDELNASNDELRLRTLQVSELNQFTEAVLAGLRAGVAVVDQDLRVLAWNSEASDLWGVREDEAVGSPLEDLDIGLPVEPLRPLLRAHLSGDGQLPGNRTRVEAVNRRGRAVEVEVTVSPLRRDGNGNGNGVSGAILVMNVVD
jgi:two-component system CheB/CheR fusion protein